MACRLADLTVLDSVMTAFEAHMDAADKASDTTDVVDTLELLPLALRGDHATVEEFLIATLQQPSSPDE